jgi:hypothetical protein
MRPRPAGAGAGVRRSLTSLEHQHAATRGVLISSVSSAIFTARASRDLFARNRRPSVGSGSVGHGRPRVSGWSNARDRMRTGCGGRRGGRLRAPLRAVYTRRCGWFARPRRGGGRRKREPGVNPGLPRSGEWERPPSSRTGRATRLGREATASRTRPFGTRCPRVRRPASARAPTGARCPWPRGRAGGRGRGLRPAARPVRLASHDMATRGEAP